MLRKELNDSNRKLVNVSLYWNQDDRFKPFEKLAASTDQCQIVYNGANEAGTDGLQFIRTNNNCQVWFLEPVTVFYDKLIHSNEIIRQLQTDKHHFLNLGLSNKNELIDIIKADIEESQALSLINKEKAKSSRDTQLKYKILVRDVAEMLFEFHILSRTTKKNIHQTSISGELSLLHMNCEGCEYDVIDRLIQTNLIQYIRIIQMGSHRIQSLASTIDKKYCCLQQSLSKTHQLQFGIPWAWERWIRNDLIETKD